MLKEEDHGCKRTTVLLEHQGRTEGRGSCYLEKMMIIWNKVKSK